MLSLRLKTTTDPVATTDHMSKANGIGLISDHTPLQVIKLMKWLIVILLIYTNYISKRSLMILSIV